jgi:hypothetical protein
MKRKIAILASSVALAFTALAASPATPPSGPLSLAPLAGAQAAVTKSLAGGGGGGNVSGAGQRLGDLLSGWAVPVLTVLAGCLLVGTLASRNVGASLGIVVITLVGLIFLLTPDSISTLAKGIASFVF